MLSEEKIMERSSIVKLEFNKFEVNLLLFNSEFKSTQRIISAFENSKEENIIFQRMKDKEIYAFRFEKEKDMIFEQNDDDLEVMLTLCKRLFSHRLFLVEKDNGLFITSFQIIYQKIIEYQIFGIFIGDLLSEILTKDAIYNSYDKNCMTFTLESVKVSNLSSGKNSLTKDNQLYRNLFDIEETVNDNLYENNLNESNTVTDKESLEEEIKNEFEVKIEERICKLKPKHKDKKLKEEDLIISVKIFIEKLKESILEDNENMKFNKPAINKIKLIPMIEKTLLNVHFQKFFLDMEGCKLLEEWLKKDESGCYLCHTILSKILSILVDLRVDIEHLRDNNLGKLVYEISKNTKLSKTIVNQAKEIIKKWSRIIFEISNDYTDFVDKQQEVCSVLKHKRKGNLSLDLELNDTKTGHEEEENLKKRLIPKKGLFDFQVRPVNNSVEKKRNSFVNYKSLLKKVNK